MTPDRVIRIALWASVGLNILGVFVFLPAALGNAAPLLPIHAPFCSVHRIACNTSRRSQLEPTITVPASLTANASLPPPMDGRVLNADVAVGVAPPGLTGCAGAELAPTADAPPTKCGCSANVASAPTHAANLMILVVMASPGKLHTQTIGCGRHKRHAAEPSADM